MLTQFAYSIDGGAYTLINNATTVTAYSTVYNYDFSGVSALQNVVDTSTVTFRFYASGQSTTGGFGFYSPTSGSDGLDIIGSVPEPATVFGGLLMLGALGWNQRRRVGGLAGLRRNARLA